MSSFQQRSIDGLRAVAEPPGDAAGEGAAGPDSARFAATRLFRLSLFASLALHASAFGALLLVPSLSLAPGPSDVRELPVQVAWHEPLERADRDAEREPEVELPEEQEVPPELVSAEEPPPREEPSPEPAPLPLDDRFELENPFECFPLEVWPAAPKEPLPPEPEPKVEPRAEREPASADAELEPEVLADPTPEYPRVARRLGLEGSVKLRAAVRRDGTVSEVAIVQSSGSRVLDEAAQRAFREWRFRPWRAGEPDVRGYVKTFTFRLP